MIPEMEFSPEELQRQRDAEQENSRKLAAIRAGLWGPDWSGATPSGSDGDDRAGLWGLGWSGAAPSDDRGATLRLLMPAQYVDVQMLMRIRNARTRQAVIDALYRGVSLHYQR